MKLEKAMTLFTRTPVHVGAGNSVGAIDSPIIRERHTNVPVIPGSSLKGVLADLWQNEQGKRGEQARKIFGDDTQSDFSAGELLVGEARCLAFPVRSAKNAFVWISSPMALERFCRDFGCTLEVPGKLDEKSCYASDKVCMGEAKDKVVLEEYVFTKVGAVSDAILEAFKKLSDEPLWKNTLAERLVIVNDEIFSYFVKNACEVATRIRINDNTGSVDNGALFNQEQLPSEAMLYSVLGELRQTSGECVAAVEAKVNEAGNVLQIGGDATIGLGFCTVNFIQL